MKRSITILIFLLSFLNVLFPQNPGYLKSILYDFDGLDQGETNLPDGDYANGDLSYKIKFNPLQHSEMLGDCVLELDLNWNEGSGEFGKAIGRFIELEVVSDRLNFYFINPLSNNGDANIIVSVTEDDNNDNVFEDIRDDRWSVHITLPRAQGWQFVSIALSDFKDNNTGGNGIFDAGYTKDAGMIFSVGLIIKQQNKSVGSEKYFLDMLCFSEGTLPTGATFLDLPPQNSLDSCATGAIAKTAPDSVPDEIESLFYNTKKLRFVNWFLDYSFQGTMANALPGAEVENLLFRGYRPVITWQMMYGPYTRLDPVQPRLNKLLAGDFNLYLDQFADKIKSYDDTIILRIFHEFDGNWYPWSLTENNSDPALYITAYRYVVDRLRARGATKVLWMWCVNAEPKPYAAYNWIIDAYPGDAYVNIVATDIYNHPDPGIPAWKSFRCTMAESYYYLTRYFPHKPFYICEIACRERDNSEMISSQTKGEWICQMSTDLRSFFSKTRALIFFSEVKEHDWRINSSTAALEAARECIWSDHFFGDTVAMNDLTNLITFKLYPNPFVNELNISAEGLALNGIHTQINIYNGEGQHIYTYKGLKSGGKIKIETFFSAGIYIVELKNKSYSKKFKVIKMGN